MDPCYRDFYSISWLRTRWFNWLTVYLSCLIILFVPKIVCAQPEWFDSASSTAGLDVGFRFDNSIDNDFKNPSYLASTITGRKTAIRWSYLQIDGSFRRPFDAKTVNCNFFTARQQIRIQPRFVIAGQFSFNRFIHYNIPGIINDLPYTTPFVVSDQLTGDLRIDAPAVELAAGYQLLPNLAIGMSAGVDIRDGLKLQPSKAESMWRNLFGLIDVDWHAFQNHRIGVAISCRRLKSTIQIVDRALLFTPPLTKWLGDVLTIPDLYIPNFNQQTTGSEYGIQANWRWAVKTSWVLRLYIRFMHAAGAVDDLNADPIQYAKRFGTWKNKQFRIGIQAQYMLPFLGIRAKIMYHWQTGSLPVDGGDPIIRLEMRSRSDKVGVVGVASDTLLNRITVIGRFQWVHRDESVDYAVNPQLSWQRTLNTYLPGIMWTIRLNRRFVLLHGIRWGTAISDYHLTLKRCRIKNIYIGIRGKAWHRTFTLTFSRRIYGQISQNDHRSFMAINLILSS